MDSKVAILALNKVMRISRAEMYKPIQVAEVLYRFRAGEISDLTELESYRVASRTWRNEVTDELLGKHSTSSAKFQDDLWSDTAVPPAALAELGKLNGLTGEIEKLIYLGVQDKYALVTEGLGKVVAAKSLADIDELLSYFAADTLTSSGDRFFEILCQSIIKTELQFSQIKVHVSQQLAGALPLSVIKSSVEHSLSKSMDAIAERLGHTNAADAGLDIWTNFGVIVNIKRRALNRALLDEILSDTPVGNLLVICQFVNHELAGTLSPSEGGRNVAISTLDDLRVALSRFESEPRIWSVFINSLTAGFKHEFPLSVSLLNFMHRRGYLQSSS